MGIYSLVDCAEEHATVSEDFDIESGMNAQVKLRCAWSNRHALVADVLGNHRAYPGTAFAQPPQAARASIVGGGEIYTTVGQACVYEYAIVTIGYSTKVTDLISESLEPTAEFHRQDFKRFRWGAPDGEPILEKEAPGKLLRGLNIVRTIYEVATIPDEVYDLVGSCNDVLYHSNFLDRDFDAETLLYQPPNLTRAFKSNGTKGWTVTLKFAYKPQGWNKYWRAKTEAWEEMFDVEGGAPYKNYPPEDFSALLY